MTGLVVRAESVHVSRATDHYLDLIARAHVLHARVVLVWWLRFDPVVGGRQL